MFSIYVLQATENYTVDSYLKDFAFLVGLKLSYQNYVDSVRVFINNDLLYETKYTARQLYWINSASYLCSKPSKGGKDDTKCNPDKKRFSMIYANMPEFANDFNCTVGSTMNPKEKCDFFKNLDLID